MKFIVENWFVIVAIAAVGGSIGYAIYSFVKMPSDKQLSKVREWLFTFDMFSMMVDEALEQMRTMLDSNEAVQKLIANEAGEGSE